MKVSEAISRAAAVYSELADDERVYPWLSEIEERISSELALVNYTKITIADSDRELQSPEYLSEVYPLYLVMKNDLVNSDHSRYVCHSAAFSAAYAELAGFYIRKREPEDANYYKFN